MWWVYISHSCFQFVGMLMPDVNFSKETLLIFWVDCRNWERVLINNKPPRSEHGIIVITPWCKNVCSLHPFIFNAWTSCYKDSPVDLRGGGGGANSGPWSQPKLSQKIVSKYYQWTNFFRRKLTSELYTFVVPKRIWGHLVVDKIFEEEDNPSAIPLYHQFGVSQTKVLDPSVQVDCWMILSYAAVRLLYLYFSYCKLECSLLVLSRP